MTTDDRPEMRPRVEGPAWLSTPLAELARTNPTVHHAVVRYLRGDVSQEVALVELVLATLEAEKRMRAFVLDQMNMCTCHSRIVGLSR